MTRLRNDPVDFTDEMIAGFVAGGERSVTGGVIRSTVVPDGQVAVVIGCDDAGFAHEAIGSC